MKLYKLTEQDSTTYNGSMNWEIGKTNRVKKCVNPQLCSSDVIHAYKNKNLALLLNPIHADINNPIMYECKGDIAVEDFGKVGVFELTPTKKLEYPKWYISEKKDDALIMFAILCAESVLSIFENKYTKDYRPRKAIEAAKTCLFDKTTNAADAAHVAADAAEVAYADAYCTDAAYAAEAAAHAAHAAAHAVRAAADAVRAAADAVRATNIDFCKLADKAVKIIMKE